MVRPGFCPQMSLRSVNPVLPAEAQSAVTRRQRPRRSSERQRGGATSTLAASVGLRHPLSPAGMGDGDSADWHAAERLSQVNLDAIVFPGVLQTGSSGDAIPAGPRLPLETDRRSPNRRISESSPGSSTQQHPEAGVPPEDSDEAFFQNLPCPSPPELPVAGESSMEDSPRPPPPPPPPPPDVDQGAAGRCVCCRRLLLQRSELYFVGWL